MNITRYDPFRSLYPLSRWFDDFDEGQIQKGLKLREDEKNIYVEGVVAGVPADDVRVDIEDGVVVIKAEKKYEDKDKENYRSSSYQYYYSCALSGGKWDKAEADVDDGIVTVTIPKEEASRPRKISVKAKSKK